MKTCSIILTFFILFLGVKTFNIYNEVFAEQSATIEATIKTSVCGNHVREGGEQCDSSNLGGKNCSKLGFSGGTLDCSASCEFDTTACTTDAEATATPQFTSSEGGTHTLNSGNNSAKITLPANFHSQDLQLQEFSHPNNSFASTKPAPSGKNFIGKTYDFIFVDPDGETVSTLSQSATMVLTYADSDVSGIDENTLAPYRWGSDDSSWQLIAGATVDTANNKVTFSTASFSSFVLLGSPQQEEEQQQGGGGGGSYAPPQINLSGRAFPLSKVTVLKDGQIAITTIAGPDAKFSISLSGLSSGNYTFSVYGEDDSQRRSILFTFPVFITQGAATDISGIFIAPTIAVDKSEVKKGDNISIFGRSAPSSTITIGVSSEEKFVKTQADKNGAYLYNLDTASLEIGDHAARSKSALDEQITPFSKTVSFKVGTESVLAKEINQMPAKGDLNNDKRVNLIDFSVAAHWYERSSPPATIDLNKDGKVDLTDFSIMAYYWTG